MSVIRTSFQDLSLPRLGFGAMRLPNTNGVIDEKQVFEMVDIAMAAGVNYFDTAYPYHNGLSENVMGAALARYPRESWYLADKYPGHQYADTYDPAEIFEKQLKKCGVEYFDFYLLHNVYENSIGVYLDPQWKIMEYFAEQKLKGRIRYLGFSTHGSAKLIEEFLDKCGVEMDFCQIQLNYLDWTLQDAKTKVELLEKRGIPVWVMEPLRGGRLVNLPAEERAKLDAFRPEENNAAWAFRFLLGKENVKLILSGMSNLEQMKDNLHTFEKEAPLTEAEENALLEIAEGMKKSVPCTACRYCTAGCPMGLDIPYHLSILNELRVAPVINAAMRLDALPENKRPEACIACGKCTRICPQKIDIPAAMKELTDRVSAMPSWAQICRERAEAAKRNG